METNIYKPKNKIRIVTAASLFDGHDVSINIMRRIMQQSGCEIIHLGHNRSVQEIVKCAIQEDAQAIAITSYQGGHNEYLKYMYDLLKENGREEINIFAGGGGTILPIEKLELESYGITRIYLPDDGREMGLQGMINDVIIHSDFPLGEKYSGELMKITDSKHISRLISLVENYSFSENEIIEQIRETSKNISKPILGITGTGGSGKSSLTDEIIRRYLNNFPEKKIAIISIDPSKKKTGGALLGDRIRMNAINNERVYMRSMATRQANLAMSKHIGDALNILKLTDADLIILETSGIGQSDTEILDYCNVSLYVMTPEFGAATQLEKIDMLDFADFIAINKFDKKGAKDAYSDVIKQYKRNHLLFEVEDDKIPVFATMASKYGNVGMNDLYDSLIYTINSFPEKKFEIKKNYNKDSELENIIPVSKIRYLSEISDTIKKYNQDSDYQEEIAHKLFSIYNTIKIISNEKIIYNQSGILSNDNDDKVSFLINKFNEILIDFDNRNWLKLIEWDNITESYKNDMYVYKVRDKEICVETKIETLSGLKVPKISLPKYKSWGDLIKWMLQENLPGYFPYTAGIYPFKRTNEDPTRMFAGEGNPERTNIRFHYLSKDSVAKRLSTAFDSVTLYGADPDLRPDIYGKIGNAGVSVCCLDDMKKLYSGFDLSSVMTSVSMTINGPAPIILSYFFNAAIDQNVEKYIKSNGLETETKAKIKSYFEKNKIIQPKYNGELPDTNDGLGLMFLGVSSDKIIDVELYNKIKADTIAIIRGTVQADILKEDQAQNTCIFSTEFALKLMGDVQEYFIINKVRNFYSVSISGYHIAEAGANPITQLAFTLSNGFTYLEYYLSRGMKIDEFAPNLSFFFSNGLDPEYAVIGRVARRIWAKAIKYKYNGNSRSQLLKYHIQTSGRSLHAQEIDFNDIRTTLQALYAIYDNCNSLHTNAYDEAITTPTEESVRRAVAIQLIINKELGTTKNENPNQGSFLIEELTNLVEEAVLMEFDRINERGGVIGAMETMYQRNKIQEESMNYEHKKHNGDYPIIGVNTYMSKDGSKTEIPEEIIRATENEKKFQLDTLKLVQKQNKNILKKLETKIINSTKDKSNLFEDILEISKDLSLGQITNILYNIGGQYRRNM